MLIRVDYSGLLDLPIFTRYEYITIVGEKVSGVFLINHYLSLKTVLYKITVFILLTARVRKFFRARIVKVNYEKSKYPIEYKRKPPF